MAIKKGGEIKQKKEVLEELTPGKLFLQGVQQFLGDSFVQGPYLFL